MREHPKVQGVNQRSCPKVQGGEPDGELGRRGCAIPRESGSEPAFAPQGRSRGEPGGELGGRTTPGVGGEPAFVPQRGSRREPGGGLGGAVARSPAVQGVHQPSCPKDVQGVNLAGELGGGLRGRRAIPRNSRGEPGFAHQGGSERRTKRRRRHRAHTHLRPRARIEGPINID